VRESERALLFLFIFPSGATEDNRGKESETMERILFHFFSFSYFYPFFFSTEHTHTEQRREKWS
jgi:hypothetical protein